MAVDILNDNSALIFPEVSGTSPQINHPLYIETIQKDSLSLSASDVTPDATELAEWEFLFPGTLAHARVIMGIAELFSPVENTSATPTTMDLQQIARWSFREEIRQPIAVLAAAAEMASDDPNMAKDLLLFALRAQDRSYRILGRYVSAVLNGDITPVAIGSGRSHCLLTIHPHAAQANQPNP